MAEPDKMDIVNTDLIKSYLRHVEEYIKLCVTNQYKKLLFDYESNYTKLNLFTNVRINDPKKCKEILFSRFEKLDQLFSKLKENCIDIIISGSTIVSCIFTNNFQPDDIDAYIVGKYDKKTIKKIDEIINEIYGTGKIMRYPYTLNWARDKINFQLILPQIDNESQIFASYHSDFCCAYYSVLEEKFKYTSRFIKYLEDGICVFISDNSNGKIRKICDKYTRRGFNCLLCTSVFFEDYGDINMSPKNKTNYDIKLCNNLVTSSSENIEELYTGTEKMINIVDAYCVKKRHNDVPKILQFFDIVDIKQYQIKPTQYINSDTVTKNMTTSMCIFCRPGKYALSTKTCLCETSSPMNVDDNMVNFNNYKFEPNEICHINIINNVIYNKSKNVLSKQSNVYILKQVDGKPLITEKQHDMNFYPLKIFDCNKFYFENHTYYDNYIAKKGWNVIYNLVYNEKDCSNTKEKYLNGLKLCKDTIDNIVLTKNQKILYITYSSSINTERYDYIVDGEKEIIQYIRNKISRFKKIKIVNSEWYMNNFKDYTDKLQYIMKSNCIRRVYPDNDLYTIPEILQTLIGNSLNLHKITIDNTS